MKIKDKSYIAGFMDGEGSINVVKRTYSKYSNSYLVVVNVYNTHKPVLLYIQQLYGGIMNLQSESSSKKMCKKLWRLRFRNQEAKKLLRDIKKFLKIKKKQAYICLCLLNRLESPVKRNKLGQILKITNKEMSIREKFYKNYKLAQKEGKSLYAGRTVTKW